MPDIDLESQDPANEEASLLRQLQADMQSHKAEHAATMRGLITNHEVALCDKFKQLREQRGWSQEDVSDRLREIGFDMHQTTVAKMEKGKRPLRVAELFALSHVFGLPPVALLYLPVVQEHPGMEYMRKRLEAIDETIKNTKSRALEAMNFNAERFAELTLERTAILKVMKESAENPGIDNGEHPEEG
jgi:transcriptional regulator with XRE-family HTH domain